MSDERRPARRRGRPRTLTHAHVARRALELFSRHGFEETSVDEIAAALGVSRRTLFRYFRSKNDMVWGDFDWVLGRLRRYLDERPPDEPLMESLSHAVVASNRYGPDQLPELRIRMRLITTVPALQAHSMIRYMAWRGVVAEFVARRLGQQPDDLIPLTIGHAALGTSMAAFARWVDHPAEDLEENLRRGYEALARGFDLPAAPRLSGANSPQVRRARNAAP